MTEMINDMSISMKQHPLSCLYRGGNKCIITYQIMQMKQYFKLNNETAKFSEKKFIVNIRPPIVFRGVGN